MKIKKLISMGLAAIMAVSAMAVTAFAEDIGSNYERVMSEDETVKTVYFDDGSSAVIHSNPGYNIVISDCDEEDGTASVNSVASIYSEPMVTNFSSVMALDFFTLTTSDSFRDTYNTATADTLFSNRTYSDTAGTIRATLKTNSSQSVTVDIVGYNMLTKSYSVAGYVDVSNLNGSKYIYAYNTSVACRYYFRLMNNGGNAGTGYVQINKFQ